MNISVIIPTFNEENNIGKLLASINKILKDENYSYEIIVVDVGSTDRTREIAEEEGAKVIVQKLPGYGGALKEGFEKASGEWFITMDADLSHNPVFIKEMLLNKDKAEVIIASRYVKGGSASIGIFRRILSIILNRVFTMILSLPYRDISSGFRMYHRKAIEKIIITARNFDVLEEILIRIHSSGGKIIEIPFHYKIRESGKSHAKLVEFGISYMKTLYKMWRLKKSFSSGKK